MANEKKSVSKSLLTAIIYFLAGLLLCLSIVNVDGLLSIMLGILLVLLACGLLLGNILREKKVAPETIVPTSFLLAVGLSFFFWAFPFLEIMALFLTCAGAIILIDSILDIVIAKKSVKEWVIKMAVAVVALTLGILLLAIPDFRRFAGLILGIILIIYAVLTAIPEFTKE